jgi:hypothetical protein
MMKRSRHAGISQSRRNMSWAGFAPKTRNFGITEAIGAGLSAFGGADLLGGLGSLLGIGGAAAAPAAAAGTEAAAGTSIADLVGTGTGLFGGSLGTEGSLLAAGVPATDIASGAAFGTAAGGGALGTALDFLSAPAASGFNAAALTPGFGAAGGGPGVLDAAAPPPVATGAGGTSVFDTGTAGIPGVNASGAPAATGAVTPPGASAASIAAPAGVTAPADATSAVAGAAPAAGGAAPAAQSTSISDLLSKAGSGALKSLTSNPLGVALGAGGLGYSIFEGSQNTANEKALQASASTANANSAALEGQGQGLVNYLTSGTLPPQYQTQITQSIQSAIASAKSAAAAQGLPTDPAQNTALATQIQEIQNQEPILQEQIAAQLAGTGTSLIQAGAGAAGLSGTLYQALVQNDTTQAANAGKAIATLAAALNGKSNTSIGSTNIQLSAA